MAKLTCIKRDKNKQGIDSLVIIDIDSTLDVAKPTLKKPQRAVRSKAT